MALSREKIGNTAGAGCITLFGSVFLLAGLAAVYSAQRSTDQNAWVGVAVGVLFAAVGAGIIYFSRWAARKAHETEALEARYPGRPWMWREDWAQGKVLSRTKGEMVFAWVFALLWNAISSPALIFGRDEIRDDAWVWALVLLFPLVGLFLLWWAVRSTLRYVKFGDSELRLDTLPGVVGGKLRGRVHTRLQRIPRDGVFLSLRSLRKIDSGDSTTEKLIWEQEKMLPAAELSRDYRGVTIPVDFTIPSHCEPAAPRFPQTGVVWKLSATAEVDGVDFGADFDAPVFRTADSADDVEEEIVEEIDVGWDPRSGRRSRRAYIERPSPAGGVEYYFPAGRNRGAAFGTTMFLLLWLGAGSAMHHFGVPWFFLVLWGLFALLIGWGTLDLWFGRWCVFVGTDRLESTYKLLFGKTRSYRFDEIEDVAAVAGMTQSETATQAAKAWYDVQVTPKFGKPRAIVKSIRSKAEAHRFAREVERRIRGGRL